MDCKEIKQKIDTELNMIIFTDSMKKKVLGNPKKQMSHSMLRYVAIIALTFLIGGTTVFAGYYFFNKVNVNETTLPELNEMQIVEMAPLNAEVNKYGHIHKEFFNYATLQSNLGIDLLESKYATDQSYIQGSIETDQKDYAIIKMENYIIGDTHSYMYLEGKTSFSMNTGKSITPQYHCRWI